MSIEEVFSSRGRIRILKILTEIKELNISEIAKRAGLNYATTKKHLQALEKVGILEHKKVGRIHIFRFKEEDLHAMMIKKLIDCWANK